MKHPVSIIIPVYNTEKYIDRCIKSILIQTFTDFECILIDDCSTDNSFAICDYYTKKDTRFKIIRNKKNIGVSLSRKKGLLVSRGGYIQYIDSDDWLEKDMIEKMYQKAVSENYDMVVCDYYSVENDIFKIAKQDFSSFDKIDIIKKLLSIRIKSVLWNKMVKRELYLKAEYPKYNRSEDYVISIQNIYNSNKIGYINFPLYYYYYNSESLSNNIKTKINGRIEENKNWCILINYLKDKYESLKIFEPELSNHINEFKKVYLKDNDLRKIKELFYLYPESKFILFLIKNITKKIMKSIIPKKLRNIVKDLIKSRHSI